MRLSGAMDADQRVAVAAFVEEGELEVDGFPAVALGDRGPSGREHGGQDGRQLAAESAGETVRGVEEDEIVLLAPRGRATQEAQRIRAPDLCPASRCALVTASLGAQRF